MIGILLILYLGINTLLVCGIVVSNMMNQVRQADVYIEGNDGSMITILKHPILFIRVIYKRLKEPLIVFLFGSILILYGAIKDWRNK